MTNAGTVGEFLRARRARIAPESVGLPPEVRPRRVPGLRREEVARFAGMSVGYYVKLERGYTRGVSRTVWEAVARTLQLDDVERAHLYDLVSAHEGQTLHRDAPSQQRVSPGLRNLLATLGDVPAMVQGRRTEVLAFNDFFAAVYAGFADRPSRDRNMARFILLDPAARELYAEWKKVARDVIASLRLDAGSHPDDPELGALVGELSLHSDLFRQEWSQHKVVLHADGKKQLVHPVVGALTLNYQTFQVAGDPDQTLVMFHADPGSPSADALRLLGSWRATGSSAEPRSSEASLDA